MTADGGEPEVPGGQVSPRTVRRLIEVIRAHLTLTRFQAIVGITAGFISIGAALYSYLSPSRPSVPLAGELVAFVQDARTGKPVSDATVEVLTLKDAVVTTLTPRADGQVRGRIPEGTYRLRVTHPRLGSEARQVQIVAGQTSEVRLRLTERTAKPAVPIDQAGRAAGEAVEAVKKIFK